MKSHFIVIIIFVILSLCIPLNHESASASTNDVNKPDSNVDSKTKQRIIEKSRNQMYIKNMQILHQLIQ